MKYLLAKCKISDREAAYKIYVTDRLLSITGGTMRYADIVSTDASKKTPEPEEIKNDMKAKLNALTGG